MTEPKQVRVPDLAAMKSRGEKISMLTAYDATMAGLFDQAGVDVLLVGDSLGMVILGGDDTLEVTMEDMIRHTRAVRRGTRARWSLPICRSSVIRPALLTPFVMPAGCCRKAERWR